MDVKLTGPSGIPYLTQGSIKNYSSLKFYTQNGDVVKMNPTMLAALNSSLVESIFDFDIEDCCVITEFSKSELEEISQFSWTGRCKNITLFLALGIDLSAMFYHENLLDFKIEVKDEDFELEEYFTEDVIFNAGVNKKTTKKKLFERNLNNDQQKSYESYELPKPLEAFKVPAFESKAKVTTLNTDVDFSKPYACHVCSSRFASNQNLQSHLIKLHSEHYNCCFCKKAFALNQPEEFKLHMFKHEHKMLATACCVQCGKFFQQSYKFHEHLKRK